MVISNAPKVVGKRSTHTVFLPSGETRLWLSRRHHDHPRTPPPNRRDLGQHPFWWGHGLCRVRSADPVCSGDGAVSMRANLNYGAATNVIATPGATDISTPVAGYFRHRLRSGSVSVGIRIWFGPPLDPETGEEMDRSLRWQAQANGTQIDFDRVWPNCTGNPITQVEYDQLCARQEWAKQNAPDSAYANPSRRADPLSTSHPLPF